MFVCMCTYTVVKILQSINTRNCTDDNDKDACRAHSSNGARCFGIQKLERFDSRPLSDPTQTLDDFKISENAK